MLNKFIDLERLTTFFQGLKEIFLEKSEASTIYATQVELDNRVRFITETQYDNLKKDSSIEENITYIVYK